jgi:hypothetical protein
MADGKKPYRSPRLEVYGSIHAITDAAGKTSMTADGGTHGNMSKTA